MTTNQSSKYSNPIIESVTAVNELVIGSAASTAMASMYLTLAQAAGMGAQNSTAAQNHLNVLGTAALGAGTGNLLWAGLSRQVEDMTVDERLKYWEQMIAITKGETTPAEQTAGAPAAKGDAGTKEPAAVSNNPAEVGG